MANINWLTNAGQIPPTAAVVNNSGIYYIADYNYPKYYVWDGTSTSYTTVDMTQYFPDYSYGFIGIEYSGYSNNNLVLIGHDGTIFTNSSGVSGTWSSANYLNTAVDCVSGYSQGYIISSYYGSIYSLTGTHVTDLIDYSAYRPFKSFRVNSGYGYVITGAAPDQVIYVVDLTTGVATEILSASLINDINQSSLYTVTITEQLASGFSNASLISFWGQTAQIVVVSGADLYFYNLGATSGTLSITASFTPTGITINENTLVVWDSTNVAFYTYEAGSWSLTGSFTETGVSWVDVSGNNAFILTSSNTIPVEYNSSAWATQTAISVVSVGNIVIDPTGEYAILPTSTNITSLIKLTSGWDINLTTDITGITWIARDTVTNSSMLFLNNNTDITAYNVNAAYTILTEAFTYPTPNPAITGRFYIQGGRVLSPSMNIGINANIWCPFLYILEGNYMGSGVFTIANKNLVPDANLFTTNFQYPLDYAALSGTTYQVTSQETGPHGYNLYDINFNGGSAPNAGVPYIIKFKPNVEYTFGAYTDLTNATAGSFGSNLNTFTFSTADTYPTADAVYNTEFLPTGTAGSKGFTTQTFTPVTTITWAADTNYTNTAPPSTYIDPNGNIQVCTTPGTSGASAPTWSTVLYGVTDDGTAKWTCMSIGSTYLPLLGIAGNPSNIQTDYLKSIYWGCPYIAEAATPTQVIGYRTVGDYQSQLIGIADYFYTLSSTGATQGDSVAVGLLGYNSLLLTSGVGTALFSSLPVNVWVAGNGTGTLNYIGGAPPNLATTQIGLNGLDISGTGYVFNTMGGGEGELV